MSQLNFQRGIFLLLIFLCHIKKALSCFLWGKYVFLTWQRIQNKQNNEKGIFLLLILLSHIKREAKTLKAVLLKMAFACMWYFWKFPNEIGPWESQGLLNWVFNSTPWFCALKKCHYFCGWVTLTRRVSV